LYAAARRRATSEADLRADAAHPGWSVYLRMVKVSPSLLSADFARLGEDIKSVGGADYLHFDVMDGVFVPNISFGLPVLESVRAVTGATLDVHLMIDAPARYTERFVRAGADIVSFHFEAQPAQLHESVIEGVRSLGARAGLAIKPDTPESAVLPLIDKLDMVVVMAVEPGYGGQRFMPGALAKLRALRAIIDARGLSCELEVDGGVNVETARACIAAGAHVLVSGSDIFSAADRERRMAELRNAGKGEV
jgi:ribulose-phosphate 3-epimerase